MHIKGTVTIQRDLTLTFSKPLNANLLLFSVAFCTCCSLNKVINCENHKHKWIFESTTECSVFLIMLFTFGHHETKTTLNNSKSHMKS